jgi:RimJ/RimL family protein N-acetyltransferase
MEDVELHLPPEPIEIAAGWLQFRPWDRALAPRVLEGLTDPEVVRWAPQRGPADLAAAREWIDRQNAEWLAGKKYSLAVHEASSGELLGDVTAMHIDRFTASAWVGYWTAPWARKRGVASTALAAITRWGFEAVGFHRLQLSHAIENTASCRVAENAGYVAEGIMRSALPTVSGSWWDMELHATINTAH